MAWFEAHQELPRHPKTRKAARTLGIPTPHLVGHLWCLWGWALEMADDGNLSKFDAEDIAIGAEWEGDPDLFVEALAGCGSAGGPGFLERGGSYGPPDDATVGDLVLYGWWRRAGKLVQKRRRDARRKREERSSPADVQRTSNGRPVDASVDVQPSPSDGAAHTTQHDRTPNDTPSSTVVDTDDLLRGFDEFWEAWPKRGGRKIGKGKAQDRWRKLTLDQRREAYKGAVNYAEASHAGHQGAMDAWRWLRDRLWEDFIEQAGPDTRRSLRDRPMTMLDGEEFGL